MRDIVAALAALDPADAADVVRTLTDDEAFAANRFDHWAMPGQTAPAGAWRTWLIVGGRGFGKTRAGAEWALARAREGGPGTRIALVAGNLDEARRVMVEGSSGLLACAEPGEVVDWCAGRREIGFAGGARATLYSGASPAALRGRSTTGPGATNWPNGRGRARPGTICSWGSGAGRSRRRW